MPDYVIHFLVAFVMVIVYYNIPIHYLPVVAVCFHWYGHEMSQRIVKEGKGFFSVWNPYRWSTTAQLELLGGVVGAILAYVAYNYFSKG